MELTRKEYNIIAKNRGIIEPQNMSTKKLINTLSKYNSRCKVKNIRRKLSTIGLEKIYKIQNISKNELSQAKKLQRKSIDELKEIARLRRIKNSEKLTKEDLIISLLKSQSTAAERNYMKHFNNDANDDTYDKIRDKISDINMILSRLGNIVTNTDRKEIKQELHEKKNKKNLSDEEKEEIYDHLVKLAKALNEKEKYQYHDSDD